MGKWAVIILGGLLAAAPALAPAQSGRLDDTQQSALAKKKQDEEERKAFVARVTECEKQIKSRGLKGNTAKNYMRDCVK